MRRHNVATRGLTLAFLLSPCCLSFPSPASGSGEINPRTFATADLVCVGEFFTPRSIGRQKVEISGLTPVDVIHQRAPFSANRCYKGRAPFDLSIAYDTHEPSRGWADPGIPVGSETLVFMRRASNGSYGFSSPYFAMWHVAVHASAAPDEGGIEQLERDLSSGLAGKRPNEDALANLVALVAFDHVSPETLRATRPFEESPITREAIAALLVRIKSGDSSGVGALSAYLDRNTAVLNAQLIQEFVFYPLELVGDPAARAALESLGHSQFLWVSLSALEGVRHLHDPKSIPDLIKHLDDADSTLRYVALITLAEITGKYGEYAPSMKVFDENPARFITLWKIWWDATGPKQQNSPPG